ncbi:MAG: CstA-like transporter-associated (seleno)protein [Steroidobacteraceae bacterium]
MRRLKTLWQWLREATGDDAYERYLVHQAHAHPGVRPLSRRAFVKAEQERKWSGINRCC